MGFHCSSCLLSVGNNYALNLRENIIGRSDMKDYRVGIICCRCSNLMRIGKVVKIYEYTPDRKRCPNCNKNLRILLRKKKGEHHVVIS